MASIYKGLELTSVTIGALVFPATLGVLLLFIAKF
jgi:hypothetical protein